MFFSSGQCDLRNGIVDVRSDIGFADVQHAPSPFLPHPGFSCWSSEHRSWYFARSDDLQCATWDLPPIVARPWGVY